MEDRLGTGIVRARSGCAAALVGLTRPAPAELEAWIGVGSEASSLSGHPHARECDLSARYTRPRIHRLAGLPSLPSGNRES